MEFLNTKQKTIVVLICTAIILIISIYIIKKNNTNYNSIVMESYESSESNDNDLSLLDNEQKYLNKKEELEDDAIVLHIAGEVNEEGVIKLSKGARVIDAIEEAGGLTDTADISNVNLAYVLQDGEKIYIPKIGEEKEYIIEGNNRRK